MGFGPADSSAKLRAAQGTGSNSIGPITWVFVFQELPT